MNFVDKDGTTKIYLPVHPCDFWKAPELSLPGFLLKVLSAVSKVNNVLKNATFLTISVPEQDCFAPLLCLYLLVFSSCKPLIVLFVNKDDWNRLDM